jgi:membrane peptidoglycan carboxypeptidase
MNRKFNRRFKKASSKNFKHNNSSQRNSNKRRRQSGGLFANLAQSYRDYAHKLDLSNRSFKQRLILLGFSAATAFLVVIICLSAFFSLFIPGVKQIENYAGGESTIFYDRNGKVLYTIHGDENREIVDSKDIPESLKLATVAIEDDRFYKHNGFDLPGIIKATLSEFGIGSPRGGSTITQQLVKNVFLSSERTYTRKMKELILAVKIERRFTKDEILTMYLNQIPYGGTAYGVEKAAEVFFDKDSNELTLAESAVLASLPKAPTYYSPFGSHKYTTLDIDLNDEKNEGRKLRGIKDLSEYEYTNGLIGKWYDIPWNDEKLYLPGRTDAVLKRMEDLKYIKEDERVEARTAAVNLEFNEYKSNIKAPHFVFYVKELLEKEYGQEYVQNGGLKVYTTLDLELQKEAEKIIAEQSVANRRYGASNAALVSISAENGHVVSMVGSSDYFDEEIDGNVNMTTALRQPGSSFKPLVYMSAFLNKYAPGTVVYDVPMKLGDDEPQNYDGEFVGPISIRRGLAQSRNIPAIKAYFLGGEQDAIIDNVEKMGIKSLDRRVDYGWPIALGTGEVKMIEMVEAFSVLANNGKKVDVNPIIKVEDKDGKVLVDNGEEPLTRPIEVIDPQAAHLVTDILSDKENNLGQLLSLADRPAAAKTGTSNKRISSTEILPSNLWTIGYTPQLVTAVWAGNSDGEAMNLNASGYGGATPAWNKFMNFAHRKLELPRKEFEIPRGLKTVQISKFSGLLPSKFTPENMVISDLFASFSVPTEVDNSFSIRVSDVRNGKIPNDSCPAEFVKEVTYWNPKPVEDRFNWQAEIIAWIRSLDELDEEKRNSIRESLGLSDTFAIGVPIDEESELCKPEYAENAPSIGIVSHSDGDTVKPGAIKVTAEVDAPSGADKVEFYFEDALQQTITEEPFTGTVRVPGLKLGSTFKVKVKVFDVNGYTSEEIIQLKVGERDSVTIGDLTEGLEEAVEDL